MVKTAMIKSISVCNSVFDRFIPRRRDSDVTDFHLFEFQETNADVQLDDIANYEGVTKYINTAKMVQNLLGYRERLIEAMNIQYYVTICQKKYDKAKRRNIVQSWPVISRTRPLIGSPEVILDIPCEDDDFIFFKHKVDWNKKTHEIITMFDGEVHFYCTQTAKHRTTHLGTASAALCVKWNRQGTQFSLSLNNSSVYLMDGKTLKCLRVFKCHQRCLICNINVIEWTKQNNMIFGCSNGIMKFISHKNKGLVVKFSSGIVDLKLSYNDKYLFMLTTKTAWVNRYGFSNFVNLKTSSSVSVSWHPWQEAILAVSDLQNKSVFIYNCNTDIRTDLKIVNPYLVNHSQCLVDCVSFNPLSAELVVSFYSIEDGWAYLTVFSDLETRVDEVRFHRGRVPHFLWDGTGTKLASYGADENLVLWNFFGNKDSVEKTVKNRLEKVQLRCSQIYDLKSLKYQRIR